MPLPLQNRLIGPKKATRFWTTNGSLLSDLKGVGNMAIAGGGISGGDFGEDQNPPAVFPAGVSAAPATPAPILPGQQIFFKIAPLAATAFTSGFAKRTLFQVCPQGSASSAPALQASIIQTQTTGVVRLLLETWDGSAWGGPEVELGLVADVANQPIYFEFTNPVDPSIAQPVLRALIPGRYIQNSGNISVSGNLVLLGLGSNTQISSYRSGNAVSPNGGNQLPIAVGTVSIVPEALSLNYLMDLIQVDRRGFSRYPQEIMVPENNSRGTLTTAVTDAPFIFGLMFDGMETFGVAGVNQQSLITIYDPADQSQFEVLQIFSFDLDNGMIVVRPKPRAWPVGAKVGGFLMQDMLLPDAAIQIPVPGVMSSPFENPDHEIIVLASTGYSAGATAVFNIPNGKRFYPTEVGVMESSGGSGNVAFGDGTTTNSILAATAFTLANELSRAAFRTLLKYDGVRKLTATFSGTGTGGGMVYAKGFLRG